MAFQVIHTAPELSERERRRAHRSGPWAVSSRHTPGELMRRAGFIDIVVVDQTEGFRATAAAWIREWDAHRDELVAMFGGAEFDTRATGTDRATASDRRRAAPAISGNRSPSRNVTERLRRRSGVDQLDTFWRRALANYQDVIDDSTKEHS